MNDKLKEIIDELKIISKKDFKLAKKIEIKISKIIEVKPKESNKGKKLVKEIYEDIKMREDLNKVNLRKKDKKEESEYFSKTSKIGRISRKKVLFDMTWIFKQNKHRLNSKELFMFLDKIEKNLIMPIDYDILQTAKIRDEFVYLKDGRLFFNILKSGKEQRKAIKLINNTIIVLGKNYIFRFNNNTNEIEDDTIKSFGLLPLDSIYFIKDNLVFVWKR